MQGNSYGCNVQTMGLYTPPSQAPSPYLDYATRAVPTSFADIIDWSELAATTSSDLGIGMRRLYTYFCTPVDVESVTATDKEDEQDNATNWSRMLRQDLGYMMHCTQLGINVGTYGNDFVTVMLKHRRLIKCPRCGWQLSMREVKKFPKLAFDFNNMVFSGYCLSRRCKGKPRVDFELEHIYDRQVGNIWIKHWPIRELEFDYMDHTDELKVYWRIPQRIKQKLVEEKDPDQLHDVDLAVLQAVCENKLLRFDDSVMFHAKEPHLSGLMNRGLGIPRTLTLAKPDWFLQLLKKHCQAIAKDYVIPMEFFSMAGGSGMGMGAMDPVQQVDGKLFSAALEQMIRTHKYEPDRKYVVPFPVQHQMAGGGADQYVPATLLQLASRDLSNSLVPVAMLNGEMSVEASQIFLRMFEAFNREIPSMYNRFLWFVVNRVAALLRCSAVNCNHQSAAIADNVMVDQLLIQAAQMGKVSDFVWMSRLNLNPATETSRMLTEARQKMEMQMKLQEIQEELGFQTAINQQAGQSIMGAAADPAQQQQQGAAGQPSGDPSQQGDPAQQAGMAMPGSVMLPSQGYQPPQDVPSMEAAAQQMAQLLGQLPQAQRNQELAALRTKFSAFHALVTTELERLRNSTAMQARQQAAPNL